MVNLFTTASTVSNTEEVILSDSDDNLHLHPHLPFRAIGGREPNMCDSNSKHPLRSLNQKIQPVWVVETGAVRLTNPAVVDVHC